MRLLEAIGKALRPVRSDESKLIDASSSVSSADASILVFSPGFQSFQPIPVEYSADGAGGFPGLLWSGVPSDCQTLLLVVEDPDAPKPTPFVHTIIYNIPVDCTELPQTAVVDNQLSSQYQNLGAQMGTNSLSQAKYMAPTPPPGHGPHHYHFQLIALDVKLDFPKAPSLTEIKTAIDKHVLAFGEVVGIYER